MSNTTNVRTGGGIGFLGLLAIVFIVLKLTNFITWSWWWVLAPIWGPFVLVAVFAIVSILVIGIISIFTGRKKRRY